MKLSTKLAIFSILDMFVPKITTRWYTCQPKMGRAGWDFITDSPLIFCEQPSKYLTKCRVLNLLFVDIILTESFVVYSWEEFVRHHPEDVPEHLQKYQ